jgi:hypothetical protein
MGNSSSAKLTITDYQRAIKKVIEHAQEQQVLPSSFLDSLTHLQRVTPASLIEPVQVINLASTNPSLLE